MTNKSKMSPLVSDLVSGLKQAAAYTEGKIVKGMTKRVVMVPDVRAIREELSMSQSEFSFAYGIPLATLKGWEQHRRRLDTTAVAYLRAIARYPNETREAQTTKRRGSSHTSRKPHEAVVSHA